MRIWSTGLLLWAALFLAVPAQSQFSREVDPQTLVDQARNVIAEIVEHPDYEALVADLQTARGVLVFPRVYRGGFFVGGSGGLGVFLAFDRDRGDYSPVAFYSLGAVSLGLQFGGERAEVVMVAKTQKAVDSLFTSTLRLGGDAGVAAGPVGAGRSATVQADFLSYARSKGAFLGMSLEGSRLTVRDDFNESYYGQKLRPVEIIQERRVDAPGTRALRELLLGYRQAPAAAAPPVRDLPGDLPPAVQPGSGGLTIEELQVERL
jgi:SH3 domain-containing YSC84-like protein 1